MLKRTSIENNVSGLRGLPPFIKRRMGILRLEYHQVFRPVIICNFIDVMNTFRRFKKSLKARFDDKAMLPDISRFSATRMIRSINGKIASFPMRNPAIPHKILFSQVRLPHFLLSLWGVSATKGSAPHVFSSLGAHVLSQLPTADVFDCFGRQGLAPHSCLAHFFYRFGGTFMTGHGQAQLFSGLRGHCASAHGFSNFLNRLRGMSRSFYHAYYLAFNCNSNQLRKQVC